MFQGQTLPSVTLLSQVEAQGQVVRDGLSYWLLLQVDTVVKQECSRCLETFSCKVTGNVEQRYVLVEHGRREEVEDDLQDEDALKCEDERIEISVPLREAILLSLPSFPVCDDRCSGLCPRCGSKLSEGKCVCQKDGQGFGTTLGDLMGKTLRDQ